MHNCTFDKSIGLISAKYLTRFVLQLEIMPGKPDPQDILLLGRTNTDTSKSTCKKWWQADHPMSRMLGSLQGPCVRWPV